MLHLQAYKVSCVLPFAVLELGAVLDAGVLDCCRSNVPVIASPVATPHSVIQSSRECGTG